MQSQMLIFRVIKNILRKNRWGDLSMIIADPFKKCTFFDKKTGKLVHWFRNSNGNKSVGDIVYYPKTAYEKLKAAWKEYLI